MYGKTPKSRLCLIVSTLTVLSLIMTSMSALATVDPDDEYWDDSWNMERINVDEAWDIDDNHDYTNMGSNSITVAVIDSGLKWDPSDDDFLHNDFLRDVVWTNTDEHPGDANSDGRPGISGVDDDGDGLIDEDGEDRLPGNPLWDNTYAADDDENGYIDDYWGWDFAEDNNDIFDEGAWVGNDEEEEKVIVFHGTMVSSIIGATVNNGIGVTGIAPNVKIMPLKIWDDDLQTFDSGESGYYTHLNAATSDAINYATDNGADIISMSFGSFPGVWFQGAYETAIANAALNGVIMVAASGNYHGEFSAGMDRISYPSSHRNVISVGALDDNDNRASYSDYTDTSFDPQPYYRHVELVAPSGDFDELEDLIYVCNDLEDGDQAEYLQVAGTSFSCPAVSATLAMMLSYNPTLTPNDARRLLHVTADDVENVGWDRFTGYGCLDVENALRTAIRKKPELSGSYNHFDNNLLVPQGEGYEPAIDIDCNGYLHIASIQEYANVQEIVYFQLNPNNDLEIPLIRIETGALCQIDDSLDPAICIDYNDMVNIIWREVQTNDIMWVQMNMKGVIQGGFPRIVLQCGPNTPTGLNLLADLNVNLHYFMVFSKPDPARGGLNSIYMYKYNTALVQQWSVTFAAGGSHLRPVADSYIVEYGIDKIVVVNEAHVGNSVWISYAVFSSTNGNLIQAFIHFPANGDYVNPDLDVCYVTGQMFATYRFLPNPAQPNIAELMFATMSLDNQNPPMAYFQTYTGDVMSIGGPDEYYNPSISINRIGRTAALSDVRIIYEDEAQICTVDLMPDGRIFFLGDMIDPLNPNNIASRGYGPQYPQLVSSDIWYNPNIGVNNRNEPWNDDGHFHTVLYSGSPASPRLDVRTSREVGRMPQQISGANEDISTSSIESDEFGGRHLIWVEEDQSNNEQVWYAYYDESKLLGIHNPTAGPIQISLGNNNNNRCSMTLGYDNNGRVVVHIVYVNYEVANGNLYWSMLEINPVTHQIVDWTDHGEVVGTNSYNNGFAGIRLRSYTDYTDTDNPVELLYMVWIENVNTRLYLVTWSDTYRDSDFSNFVFAPDIDVDAWGNVYMVYIDVTDADLYLKKWEMDSSGYISVDWTTHVQTEVDNGGSIDPPRIRLDRDHNRQGADDFKNNKVKTINIVFAGNANLPGVPSGDHIYYTKYLTDGSELISPRIVFPPNVGEYNYWSSNYYSLEIALNYENEIGITFTGTIETNLIAQSYGYNWHDISTNRHLWFMKLSNNGEILQHPAFINNQCSNQCNRADITANGVNGFEVLYIQEAVTYCTMKYSWITLENVDFS